MTRTATAGAYRPALAGDAAVPAGPRARPFGSGLLGRLEAWLLKPRGVFERYAGAVAAAAIGFVARELTSGLIDVRLVYTFFYPSVAYAAIAGGLGPGLVCVGVSGVLALAFVLPATPVTGIANATDMIGLAAFCLVATLMAVLAAAQRSTALQEAAAAAALGRIADRQKALLEASFAVVWRTDAAGRIAEPQPEWAAYTGQRWPDQTSEGWEAMLHPDDRDRALISWRAALVARRSYEARSRIWHAPSRAYRRAILRAVPVGEAGEREWIWVIQDIEDFEATRDALGVSSERLALAQEAGGVGFFDWDLATDRMDWSEGQYRLYGIPTGSFGGTGEAWAALVVPEDVEVVRAAQALCTAEQRTELAVEFRAQRPGGPRRWLALKARVLYDGGGQPLRIVGVNVDVHARREAIGQLAIRDADLIRHAADLARSNADLANFAHVAAHDLKEPLRGIRLNAAFLEEDCGPALQPEHRARVEAMSDAAARMHALLDALLEYSSVGARELRVAPEPLHEIAAAAADALRATLAQSGGRVEIDPDLPTIPCDRVLIGQVVGNLIVNGLKYNTATDRLIRIGFDAQRRAVFVQDNGIGIRPEHRESVFRMFKRLHARGAFGGGTGAGLAIVKKIIERHGGRIWVDPAPEQGSIFYFTLGPGAEHATGLTQAADAAT